MELHGTYVLPFFIVQVMLLYSQLAVVTVCCASKFAGIPSTVRRSTCSFFFLNSAKLVLTTAAAKLPVAGAVKSFVHVPVSHIAERAGFAHGKGKSFRLSGNHPKPLNPKATP